MHIYKTRQFEKWASKEGLADSVLALAVSEMEMGLVDADLGGHVVKKRVALHGRGKSGGARTLVAYQFGDRAFFIYGFAKNERDNIDARERKVLKHLASIHLGLSVAQITRALADGKLIEVRNED